MNTQDIVINYISWLGGFPLFVAVMILLLHFLLFMVVLYVLLFLFLFLIALTPGSNFMFVNIENLVVRWLTDKLSQPRGKTSILSPPTTQAEILESRLLEILGGDIPTAKRLLRQQKLSKPGMSTEWYLQKVIWDLERDRGLR